MVADVLRIGSRSAKKKEEEKKTWGAGFTAEKNTECPSLETFTTRNYSTLDHGVHLVTVQRGRCAQRSRLVTLRCFAM